MAVKPDVLESLLHLDLYEAGWKGPESYPDQTIRQFVMSALAKSFLSKFHNDVTDTERDEKALALFLECNDKCRNQAPIEPRRLVEEYVLGEFKSLLHDFYHPSFVHLTPDKRFITREPNLLNLSDIATHFGLGHGSNIGAKDANFYTKIANSTMSHTNEVLPLLFRQAIDRDKVWSDVEAFRSGNFSTDLVQGSRLSFAPKKRDISRTICTEAVLNMLFQKGIGDVHEGRLLEISGIDLSKQPEKNAALARIGSLDGSFGTIDLKSASDMKSLLLLRTVLPRQPLEWLMRCRSPNTILPDGTVVELHMISSMGNGFTFPLMTTLFTCLVLACYRVLDLKVKHPRGAALGNYGVFGDDIVVDRRAYDLVVSMLELLGFTVNRDKSFNEGFFRESCGHDYYRGHNARGVYIKRLRNAGDIYSAINRLNRWSATHGILLTRTVGYLRSGCRFLGVPYDEADDAGIKVPLALLRSARRDRNGAVLYMARVNVSRRANLSAVEARHYSGATGPMTSWEYAEFIGMPPDVVKLVKEKALHGIRRSIPSFAYNPSALLMCLLAGWLRNGSGSDKLSTFIGLRALNAPKPVLRRRRCPGWDTSYVARGVSHEFYSRWKMAVEANLVS